MVYPVLVASENDKLAEVKEDATTMPDSKPSLDCPAWLLCPRALPNGAGSLCRASGGTTAPAAACGGAAPAAVAAAGAPEGAAD